MRLNQFWIFGTLVLKITTFVSPICIVSGGINESNSREFDCASFALFGPQDNLTVGQLIVLDCPQLLEPNQELVAGKIVVVGEVTVGCESITGIYSNVNSASALALVVVKKKPSIFPLGAMVYFHESWDICRYCNSGTRLIEIDSTAVEAINHWRHGSNFVASINPASHSSFRDLFDSYLWLIVIRVSLPSLAILASLDALVEVLRIISLSKPGWETDSRTIGLIVCAMEVPCMSIIAFVIAAGLYGPYILSASICQVALASFNGCGIFETLLLALHLSELRRKEYLEYEQRSLLSHYRFQIISFGMVTVLPDMFIIAISLAHYSYYMFFKYEVLFLLTFIK